MQYCSSGLPRRHLLASSLALLVLGPMVARADGSGIDGVARAYEQQLRQIRDGVRMDLRQTERLFGLKPSTDSRIFKSDIAQDLEASLNTIATRVRRARYRGQLHQVSIDLGGGMQTTVLSSHTRPRIGFYGVSSNPLTQGHITLALRAVAEGKLDHVVLVPSGTDDRKPALGDNQALRHTLARRGLAGLPCLSYSPIARNSPLDGETSFTRWRALNSKEIEAVYIAGGDHNHYFKNGRADTLGKIAVYREKGLLPNNISVMLFDRQGYSKTPAVPPKGVAPVAVTYLSSTRFESSSSILRDALEGVVKGTQPQLLLMPRRSARTLVRFAGGTAGGKPRPERKLSPQRVYQPAKMLLPSPPRK